MISHTLTQRKKIHNLKHRRKGQNSRRSVVAHILLPTAHGPLLANKRISIHTADRPVQDAAIRACSHDQLRRLRRPETVVLGHAEAVARSDDGEGAVGTGVDCGRAGGGLVAICVGEVEGCWAVVDDGLGGEGVRCGCEDGEEGGQAEGGRVLHVGVVSRSVGVWFGW